MSLDNTSHPGRPGLDELVPSRYALRVGEIDVMVVSDGVLSLPGAMLGHNADPAVRAAWLDDMFLPPDVLEWALNVVVVRSGGRTILIDAGIGMEFPDLRRAGLWAQRLEDAGIDPASVTDVVLTHMHMDHVGGLLADGVKERLRPDLRVHVAAAEAIQFRQYFCGAQLAPVTLQLLGQLAPERPRCGRRLQRLVLVRSGLLP